MSASTPPRADLPDPSKRRLSAQLQTPILLRKLESLEESWSAHQSRVSDLSPVRALHIADQSLEVQSLPEGAHDQSSVGGSTISTLSSVGEEREESVFDRLYRNRTRSSKRRHNTGSGGSITSSGTGSRTIHTTGRYDFRESQRTRPHSKPCRRQTFHEPVTPKAGVSSRRNRDRLNQYKTESSTSSSVFDRLRRNEERPSLAWKAAPVDKSGQLHTMDEISPSATISTEPTTLDEDIAAIYEVGQEIANLQAHHTPNPKSKADEALELLASIHVDDDEDVEDLRLSPINTNESISVGLSRKTFGENNQLSPGQDMSVSTIGPQSSRKDTSKADWSWLDNELDENDTLESPLLGPLEQSWLEDPRNFSGFFSLDEPSGGLVMAYNEGVIAGPHEEGKGSSSKIILKDQPHTQWSASVAIQSTWRRYYAQLVAARSVVQNWSISFDPELTTTGRVRHSLERQSLIQECFLSHARGQALVLPTSQRVRVSWERVITTDNLYTRTVNVLAETSQTRLLRVWGFERFAFLVIRICLRSAQSAFSRSIDEGAALSIQRFFRRDVHKGATPIVHTEQSVKGGLSHVEAAVVIQRWFRIAVLRRALSGQEIPLDNMSATIESILSSHGESSSSSVSVIFEEAKKSLLGQTKPGSQCPSYEKEEEVQPYSALAVHSLVRLYVTGLRNHRRSTKARQIQTCFRKYRASGQYSIKRGAIVVLQNTVRKHQRLKAEAEAVRVIQRRWKLLFSRNFFRSQKQKVIQIQSAWRRYRHSLQYERTKRALTALQTNFRSRSCRKIFWDQREKAIVIQRWWRHSQLRTQLRAASQLQARWRTFHSQRRYALSLFAIVIMQSAVRTHIQRSRYMRVLLSICKVQNYWRWNRARAKFISQKKAIVLLQTIWRMHRDRAMLNRARSAVVLLQKSTRRVQSMKRYVLVLSSTLRIQAAWRSLSCQRSFLSKRASVLRVQSWVRMLFGKKILHQLRRSVLATIAIQSIFRRNRHRAVFQLQLQCIRRIQNFWRSEHQSARYRLLKTSAVLIQANWRMHWAMMILWRSRQCAISIQKVTRKSLAVKHFIATRSATVLIQSIWHMHSCRRKYQNLLQKVVRLQCWFRVESAKQQAQRIKAAYVIQTCYRRHLAQRHFSTRRRAALLLQKTFRTSQMRRAKACVVVQSAVRRTFCAVRYKRLRASIMLLQARIRMLATRERYRHLRCSVARIQVFWRMQHQAKKIQAVTVLQACIRSWLGVHAYQYRRVAALMIQANCRMFLHRRSYIAFVRLRTKAALEIQRTLRGWKSRSRYRLLRSSCLLVQQKYRSYRILQVSQEAATKIQKQVRYFQSRRRAFLRATVERARRQDHEAAAIAIQRWWFTSLSYMKERQSAAVKIQSTLRRRVAWREKGSILAATTRLQAHVRGVLARQQYVRSRVAVTMLQSLFRGAMTRKRMHQRKVKQRLEAASFIQASWRSLKARRAFRRIKSAVLLIQKTVRLRRASQREASVIRLQSLWRGAAIRRHVTLWTLQSECIDGDAAHPSSHQQSAIQLQAVFRGYLSRSNFERTRRSIMRMQSILKARRGLKRQAKIDLSRRRDQAMIIQKAWRVAIARSCYREQFESSVKIQAKFRGYRDRLALKKAFASSVRIQTFARKVFATHRVQRLRERRQVWRVQKESSASTAIAACFRAHAARTRFLSLRTAAIRIQAAWKRGRATSKFRRIKQCAITIQRNWRSAIDCESYQHLRVAVVIIQSALRGYAARAKFLAFQLAFVRIQACIRRFLAHRLYSRQRKAIVLIQRRWRSCLDLIVRKHRDAAAQALELHHRSCRTKHQELACSCVKVQSLWRGFAARDRLLTWKRSAVTIQAMIRMKQTYETFRTCRRAVLVIQRFARAETERSRYFALRYIALRLQSRWRGHVARQNFALVRVAAIILQSTVRGFLVRRKFRYLLLHPRERERLGNASRHIQEWFFHTMVENALLDITSAVVLLARCRRKQLHRSAVRFALTVISASIHSDHLGTLQRVLRPHRRQQLVSLMIAWNSAAVRAQDHAAVSIQSTVRGFLARSYLHASHGRDFLVSPHQTMAPSTEERKRSAVLIQRCVRRWQSRIRLYVDLVVKVQCWFRQVLARRMYMLLHEKRVCFISATSRIQRAVREWLQRRRLLRSAATCRIQKVWRRYVEARIDRQELGSATSGRRHVLSQRVPELTFSSSAAIDVVPLKLFDTEAERICNRLLSADFLVGGACLERLSRRVRSAIDAADADRKRLSELRGSDALSNASMHQPSFPHSLGYQSPFEEDSPAHTSQETPTRSNKAMTFRANYNGGIGLAIESDSAHGSILVSDRKRAGRRLTCEQTDLAGMPKVMQTSGDEEPRVIPGGIAVPSPIKAVDEDGSRSVASKSEAPRPGQGVKENET